MFHRRKAGAALDPHGAPQTAPSRSRGSSSEDDVAAASASGSRTTLRQSARRTESSGSTAKRPDASLRRRSTRSSASSNRGRSDDGDLDAAWRRANELPEGDDIPEGDDESEESPRSDSGFDIDAAGFTGQRVHRKTGDEPMSPLTVVLYVTAVYLTFQLLTRSSDEEILGHLAPDSHIRYAHRADSALPGTSSSSHQHSYMPYGFPHIPSPLPPSAGGDASGAEQGMSWGRFILGLVMYPFYIIVTLLAVPVPLLLNLAHLLASVLRAALYPVTTTTRFMFRTFLFTPLGAVRAILAAFYPIYMFVGGVVGTGCVLGVGAAWAGRLGLDLLLGRRRGKTSKRVKVSASSRSNARIEPSHMASASSAHRSHDMAAFEEAWSRRSSERLLRGEEPSRKSRRSDPYRYDANIDEAQHRSKLSHTGRTMQQARDFDRGPSGSQSTPAFVAAETLATGRQAKAIGVRRRGMRPGVLDSP